ncbi:MAG: oxidoreductase [Bacteroidales bacterium]|jgi:NAD(P)-dependent dehydrogenase (short-subunit alcohol dehydrogenase family)|nr:oxidoreductase [Bacteroidales bacterium]MDD4385494.1 oxidoreductase [Bacteroidales bacterium]
MRTKKWTLKDMPDQSGKTVVVTGGNSGLGFETAKALAQKGADVVLACRSESKGEAAKTAILTEYPEAKVIVMALDLMDLSSIKSFAQMFTKNYSQLHILINNAGIMTSPYGLTKDGFESQMGTNHLGHFALTGLLLDTLVRTPNSRVVVVSSLAHRQWKISFDNTLFENAQGYNSMRAYARSKLANLLFTYELQRKFEAKGINNLVVAAHPGASFTNLGRHLEGKFLFKVLRPLIIKVLPTPKSGALPQLRAAVDTNVKGGEFYGPSGLMELSGYPVLVKSTKASHNAEDAQKLWTISEELTGVKYGF